MGLNTTKYSLHKDPEEPGADEFPQHGSEVKMTNERARSHATGSTIAALISAAAVVALMGFMAIIFWNMWGIPQALNKNGVALQKLLSLLQAKDTSKAVQNECEEKDCSASNGGLQAKSMYFFLFVLPIVH